MQECPEADPVIPLTPTLNFVTDQTHLFTSVLIPNATGRGVSDRLSRACLSVGQVPLGSEGNVGAAPESHPRRQIRLQLSDGEGEMRLRSSQRFQNNMCMS